MHTHSMPRGGAHTCQAGVSLPYIGHFNLRAQIIACVCFQVQDLSREHVAVVAALRWVPEIIKLLEPDIP